MQRIAIKNAISNDFIFSPLSGSGDSTIWNWGMHNLQPMLYYYLAKNANAHRRVINDKADYVSGRGFAYDDTNKALTRIVEKANYNDSLRSIINKLAIDKYIFGNAFIEIVIKGSMIVLFHHDASKCRLDKDNNVVIGDNWALITDKKSLKKYPEFSKTDGEYRSIIHYKDYEPTYSHYGVPAYIAGITSAEISARIDTWNLDRLINSFQLSGVMQISGNYSNEEAQTEAEIIERKFSGVPGQVMFILKQDGAGEGDATKFVPIASGNEGDWNKLHEISISDAVISNSWFHSLTGLNYSSGFDSGRILNDYEIALNTIIRPEQKEFIEPIITILENIGIDCKTLEFVNTPPITAKPSYMKIWEARKADGLDYSEEDPAQNEFLKTI